MAAKKFYPCAVRQVPEELVVAAAATAIKLNPSNAPSSAPGADSLRSILELDDDDDLLDRMLVETARPAFLAGLTGKLWPPEGVRLTVSFMETTAEVLRNRILEHMNAWRTQGQANVEFVYTANDGDVRISRGQGGYWSYLGTDIRHIPAGQPTLNLQGFVMKTPEEEFKRVVRHETGHTLGFPHEHMRGAIIAKLDPEKTVAYFKRYQGWTADQTRQQVLTALAAHSIRGTPEADDDSIMCYQLPGSITRDGQPIPGGGDINATDAAWAATLYPLAVKPPPAGEGGRIVITYEIQNGKLVNPVVVGG